jgi:hypothetical protein
MYQQPKPVFPQYDEAVNALLRRITKRESVIPPHSLAITPRNEWRLSGSGTKKSMGEQSRATASLLVVVGCGFPEHPRFQPTVFGSE